MLQNKSKPKPEDKTILVVDDEEDILFALRLALEEAGFNVMTATDGQKALERVKEKIPDLISLDLIMPRSSGIKFFHELRRDRNLANIPVVIVSGHIKEVMKDKESKDVLEGVSIQAPRYYFEKPVEPEDYVSIVKDILGIEIEKKTETKKTDLSSQDLLSLFEKADNQTKIEIMNLLNKKSKLNK